MGQRKRLPVTDCCFFRLCSLTRFSPFHLPSQAFFFPMLQYVQTKKATFPRPSHTQEVGDFKRGQQTCSILKLTRKLSEFFLKVMLLVWLGVEIVQREFAGQEWDEWRVVGFRVRTETRVVHPPWPITETALLLSPSLALSWLPHRFCNLCLDLEGAPPQSVRCFDIGSLSWFGESPVQFWDNSGALFMLFEALLWSFPWFQFGVVTRLACLHDFPLNWVINVGALWVFEFLCAWAFSPVISVL